MERAGAVLRFSIDREVEAGALLEPIMMNRQDRELLDKQLSRLDQPPPSGVLMLAAVAVFFAGMALGGFLFAYTSAPPLQVAANDLPAAARSAPPLPIPR